MAYKLLEQPKHPVFDVIPSACSINLCLASKTARVMSLSSGGLSLNNLEISWRDNFEKTNKLKFKCCSTCGGTEKPTVVHACGYNHCENCMQLCTYYESGCQNCGSGTSPKKGPTFCRCHYCTMCGKRVHREFLFCRSCSACSNCCLCSRYSSVALEGVYGKDSPKIKLGVEGFPIAGSGGNLDAQLCTYYVLSELSGLLEVAYDKKELNYSVYSKLKAALTSEYVPLCEDLANYLFDQAVVASAGELRHVLYRASFIRWISYPDSLLALSTGCIAADEYKVYANKERVEVYKDSSNYDPHSILKFAEDCYNNLVWTNGYGGSLWGQIATTALQKDSDSHSIFVDRIVDLVHNGGTFILKPTGLADVDMGRVVRIITVKAIEPSLIVGSPLKSLLRLSKRSIELLRLAQSAGLIKAIPEHMAVKELAPYKKIHWKTEKANWVPMQMIEDFAGADLEKLITLTGCKHPTSKTIGTPVISGSAGGFIGKVYLRPNEAGSCFEFLDDRKGLIRNRTDMLGLKTFKLNNPNSRVSTFDKWWRMFK